MTMRQTGKNRNTVLITLEKEKEEESEELYEVEKLLSHRPSKRIPGSMEYLIKWKGYDEFNNTWEIEEDVLSQELLDDYWKTHARNTRKSTGRQTRKDTMEEIKLREEKAKKKRKSEEISEDEDRPPKGLRWRDVQSIQHVYLVGDDDELYAKLLWPRGRTTVCSTRKLREKIPLLLIDYYEDRLDFGHEDNV